MSRPTLRLLAVISLALVLPPVAVAQVPGSPADAARDDAQSAPPARISPRQRAALERADRAKEMDQQGAAVLAAYRTQPGVQALPGGVLYKVLRAGSGRLPTPNSTVLCRYRAVVAGGSTFDQTDPRSPTALQVAGLVPGLRDALVHMPAGSRWEIVIPAALGYGALGQQGVPPNAVLQYTVDLDSVQ